MTAQLTVLQLTGQDESHLVDFDDGQRLQPPVAEAFHRLQADARTAGFDLAIASSFRSYDRQRAIWNGKARGERSVHDDQGTVVHLEELSPDERVLAIMRYSAMPGTSRHHWGTDIDVFDRAAMPEGYQLQLTPGEVASEGMFGPLHAWLDARIGADESHGFFRPYGEDRGGVAPERWHLSYAPLATRCESGCTVQALAQVIETGDIELSGPVLDHLDSLLERFVTVPGNWCPAHYRS